METHDQLLGSSKCICSSAVSVDLGTRRSSRVQVQQMPGIDYSKFDKIEDSDDEPQLAPQLAKPAAQPTEPPEPMKLPEEHCRALDDAPSLKLPDGDWLTFYQTKMTAPAEDADLGAPVELSRSDRESGVLAAPHRSHQQSGHHEQNKRWSGGFEGLGCELLPWSHLSRSMGEDV